MYPVFPGDMGVFGLKGKAFVFEPFVEDFFKVRDALLCQYKKLPKLSCI